MCGLLMMGQHVHACGCFCGSVGGVGWVWEGVGRVWVWGGVGGVWVGVGGCGWMWVDVGKRGGAVGPCLCPAL